MKSLIKYTWIILSGLFIIFTLNAQAQGAGDAKADSVYLPTAVDESSLIGPILTMSAIIAGQTHYPDVPKKQRTDGTVEIKFILDEHGDVQDPEIIKSLGEAYDQEAMRVVKIIQHRKFDPVTKDDQPVSVEIKLPIDFNYKEMKGN